MVEVLTLDNRRVQARPVRDGGRVGNQVVVLCDMHGTELVRLPGHVVARAGRFFDVTTSEGTLPFGPIEVARLKQLAAGTLPTHQRTAAVRARGMTAEPARWPHRRAG